jgi:hypothetical protein
MFPREETAKANLCLLDTAPITRLEDMLALDSKHALISFVLARPGAVLQL